MHISFATKDPREASRDLVDQDDYNWLIPDSDFRYRKNIKIYFRVTQNIINH